MVDSVAFPGVVASTQPLNIIHVNDCDADSTMLDIRAELRADDVPGSGVHYGDQFQCSSVALGGFEAPTAQQSARAEQVIAVEFGGKFIQSLIAARLSTIAIATARFSETIGEGCRSSTS